MTKPAMGNTLTFLETFQDMDIMNLTSDIVNFEFTI